MNKTATTVVNFSPHERQKTKQIRAASAACCFVCPQTPPKKKQSISIKYRGVIKFTIVVLLFWSARGFGGERGRGVRARWQHCQE